MHANKIFSVKNSRMDKKPKALHKMKNPASRFELVSCAVHSDSTLDRLDANEICACMYFYD